MGTSVRNCTSGGSSTVDTASLVPVQFYPTTLDRSGAVRANGTLTILATGLCGSSAMYCNVTFREVR